MAVSTLPISYCANVHPGESFAQARASLETYAAPLRERMARPIATGLWMTCGATRQAAADPALVDDLAKCLDDAGLVCYTMNAFPFGNFHARRVKENVYVPDWSADHRRDFTCRVADMLSRLLPDGTDGSISTSPCAFKPLHPEGADWTRYFPKLVDTAVHLAQLRADTGKTIRLAIEPEPCCVLETTDEAIRFFHELWSHVAGRTEESAVREHLGLCYDVCHQAVEFEDVPESIARIDREGLRINKVHVTCALEVQQPTDADSRRHLTRFVEERYLHQTFARHPNGEVLSITDLTTEHALAPPSAWLECPVWRVHFHVPVNEDHLGPLSTTRSVLIDALRRTAALSYAPHLEVETYTWNVLPTDQARQPQFDLVAGLQAELESTLGMIASLED